MAPAVAEGLFRVVNGDVALTGGQCDPCQTIHFPSRDACPKCQSEQVSIVDLPTRGRIWSWTTQEYQPKVPYREAVGETFPGYVLGYVELPGACVVESRLDVPVAGAAESVGVGTPVELVLLPFSHEDGRQLTTYAFRPVSEESHA